MVGCDCTIRLMCRMDMIAPRTLRLPHYREELQRRPWGSGHAFPFTLNRCIVSESLAAATERCCEVMVSSPREAICCSVAAEVCSAPWAAVSAIPATSSIRFTTSRSEEHTSELQSRGHLVCRLLLEKKKKRTQTRTIYKSTPRTYSPSQLY